MRLHLQTSNGCLFMTSFCNDAMDYRDRGSLALWCLLLLSWLACDQVLSVSLNVGSCPVQYAVHGTDSIRTTRAVPYLFGGIYSQPHHQCINCKRGGLWSKFCSFSSTGAEHWDQQVCTPDQTQSFIKRVLQLNEGAEMLQLTPCDVWQHLRGRTIWVIGDSMAKDLFRALRCFLIEFQDLHTFYASNNYTAMSLLGNIPGEGQPWCVHMLEGTRLCQVHAVWGHLFVDDWHWPQQNKSGPGVLKVLHQSIAAADDIFILHFGLWHRKSRPEQYRQHLHSLGKYYTATKADFPHMFFMETPKQHFDSPDGDYLEEWVGTRSGPFECQPVTGISQDSNGLISVDLDSGAAEAVVKGTWRNIAAREVLHQEYGVPMLEVYNSTVTAWQFHRNNSQGRECSHFCFPSAPQLWVYTLKKTLDRYPPPPVPSEVIEKRKHKRACAIVYDKDEQQLGEPEPARIAIQQAMHRLKNQGVVVVDKASSSWQTEQEQQQQRQQLEQDSEAVEAVEAVEAGKPFEQQVQYLKSALEKLTSQNQYLMKLLHHRRQEARRRWRGQQLSTAP